MNKKALYRFNTSLQSFKENKKGKAHGFTIVEKIPLSEFTDEDVSILQQNYDRDFGDLGVNFGEIESE